MPPTTWGDILNQLKPLVEAARKQPGSTSPFDTIRRKYLKLASERSKRNTVLYGTRWTQPPAPAPDFITITLEDVHGFMEVLTGLDPNRGLDIILHSPGGSGEAVEAIVTYLRASFADVRVIVPNAAMSAATMLACASNKIVLGTHSFLGPIDPQFILQTEVGRAAVPAHAILAQFDLAKTECKDPSLLPAWLPMLRQYGPALIVQCQLAQSLSKSLVAEWLARYMFSKDEDASAKAEKIAESLSDHSRFKSHGRFIGREQAASFGLVVEKLEVDAGVEDAVLGVFHCLSHTFNGTPAVKIIESHLGKAYIKQQQQQLIQVGPVPKGLPGPGSPP